MMKFGKVDLNEYGFDLIAQNRPSRDVVIIAESRDAADTQATKFAEHISETEGVEFRATAVTELDNFHVTYTATAWAQLTAFNTDPDKGSADDRDSNPRC